MKQAKYALLVVSLLIMLAVWGSITAYQGGYRPDALQGLILVLILTGGIYAFVTRFKQARDVVDGFPVEDEMSMLIKYKSGHHAFIVSMYVWMLIFLLKDIFPDSESMLGSGILLSFVISITIKSYLTRHYNENQD